MKAPENSEWLLAARRNGQRPAHNVYVTIGRPLDEITLVVDNFTLVCDIHPSKIDWRCLVDLTVFIIVDDIGQDIDNVLDMIEHISAVGVDALYVECDKTGAVICYEYHGMKLGLPFNFNLPGENKLESLTRLLKALATPKPDRSPRCN